MRDKSMGGSAKPCEGVSDAESKLTSTQTTIQVERGWHRSMALPKEDLAFQYCRILQALGNETKAPIKTADGYVVNWRAEINERAAR